MPQRTVLHILFWLAYWFFEAYVEFAWLSAPGGTTPMLERWWMAFFGELSQLAVKIPLSYFTIYLVNNLGVRNTDLGYIWVCGGVATLLTMNLVGRLSDRFGKLLLFRIFAALTIIPVLVITNLPPVHMVVVLAATTFFMVASSGRMVPAVAMVTASSLPRYRGSFLSINSSIQQTAMGLAPCAVGVKR